mmetsp:Transcript_19073/g.43313  ORF Transcript_19073/g.43313 Transcript_19073/m.43313 type:complete len:841 (-) Transcript_19073:149-2671(-)
MSAFEELGICPEIIQAIEEDDWLLPTAVQQEAVPLILTGGDVLVASETGSGKTGAFGLPCMQIVHEQLRGKCQMRDNTGSSTRCELNPNDKDAFVRVTGEGLECKSEDDRRWGGVRGSFSVLKGKYMFEVEVVEGLNRIGWSSADAKLELGNDQQSFGFGSTGKKSSNRQFEDFGEAFKEGDVIGCLLDREKQTISYTKNGLDLGVAFTFDSGLEEVGLLPHVCGKGFAVAVKFDRPMEYPVDGFTPVGELEPEHAGKATAKAKSGRAPMCMILEPTRDLAEQTFKVIEKFSKHLEDPPVKNVLLVGGADDQAQQSALQRGVDICVGTLQKTMDWIRRGALDVTQIKFLVLDEADDLQKKDERKEISQLNQQIKRARKDRVQTLFFSATLHTPEVKTLINEITVKATWVDLKGKDSVPDTLHATTYFIDPTQELKWPDEEIASRAKFPTEQPILDAVHSKPSMSELDKKHPKALRMSERVKIMKPKMVVKLADSFNMSQCLVFCRTNIDCNNLEAYLCRLEGTKPHRGKFESGKENPYSCVVLAGARNQRERQNNLEAFKEGDVRFMICTDVAARGIDIAGLPFVIQMTLPDDIENYIHRIGRCGRAERLGLAIALVATEREKVWYHKCPSRGKSCTPLPGNTKLTIPFGSDGKMLERNEEKWHVDEGGCTAWHDENDLLAQVEARIGKPIMVMDPDDFAVPGVLESPLPEGQRKKRDEDEASKEPLSRRALKRKKEEPQAIVFGAKKNDTSSAAANKHSYAIAPTVAELGALEVEIQKMFGRAMWGSTSGAAASSAASGAPAGSAASGSTSSETKAEAPKPAAAAAAPSGERTKKKVRW